jgi:hypothetical protein
MLIRRLLAFFVLTLALVPFAAAQAQPTPRADDDSAFDERAAAAALGHLRDGLEAHSQRLFLANFDATQMPGFLSFSDQIEAYFTRYESFRIIYHIRQTSQEGERGVILADVTVENSPRGGGRITRREGQLRIVLAPSQKGWKIVDLSPRGFFS